MDAEHDGYTRLCQPITHRRRLVNIHDRYWLVLDELRGRGTHKYEFLYHFAPEAQLLVYGDEVRGEVDCRARLKQAGLQLFMYGSAPVYTEVQCGQMQPLQGWSSERYGQRKPNPVLCATMQEQAPAGMLTLLLPGTENKCSRRLNARGGRSIAAVIREGEYEDVIVQSLGNSVLHLMECALQGEFFWIRTQNGAVVQVLAINGRKLELGDHVVFENDEPLPYVMAHVWENGIVIERGEREGRVRVYVRDLRDRQFQRR